MSRLPASSIIVSAVLAVLMVLFVAWYEQPDVLPPTDISEYSETPSVPAEVETPQSCASVESELQVLVDESRSCSSNSECTIFDYGYPIQCLTSVTRDSIPMLRREFQRYHESCEYRVYYDCPTGSMSRLAVCRENRCEVELVAVDDLQDATLDHLQDR